jgi:hypothetical protein
MGAWLRAIADWVHEPLGGATLRGLRQGTEIPTRRLAQAAPEAARRTALEAEAPSPLAGGVLATLRLKFRVENEVPGEDGRAQREEVIDQLERQASELTGIARARTRALFGDEAQCNLIGFRPGSVIAEFVVFLLSGTAPQDAVARLDELADQLTRDVRGAIGTAYAWGMGTWQPGPALASTVVTEAAPPSDRGDVQITKWLLGAGAFLTASLAAIKVSDADLLHARLNDSGGFSIAFGTIVAATLLAVLWPAWQARANVTRFVMIGLTVVVIVVGAGVMGIVHLANDSLSHEIKPRIDAALSTTGAVTKLAGTVTTDGITNRHFMTVYVTGVLPHRKAVRLLSSKAGADRDGKASLKLAVDTSTAPFTAVIVEAATTGTDPTTAPRTNCHAPAEKMACLLIRLRSRPSRPRLAASWKLAKGQQPVLTIRARAAGLAAERRLLLSIREPVKPKARDGAPGRLYAATWAPDADGVIDEQLEVPIRHTKRRLCVILRGLPAKRSGPQPGAADYGVCGGRRGGVAVLVGAPPV